MNIKDRIIQDRTALIEALNNNPKAIELEDGVARIYYASNTNPNDPSNAPCMVLQHDFGSNVNSFDLSLLIQDRRLNQNMAITPQISSLTSDLASKKISLNEDVLAALMDFDSSLSVMQRNVLNSHLVDWALISSKLENKGMDPDKIYLMRDNILTLAEAALVANTDEKGQCPLTSVDHLVNNMLSKQGQRKIFEQDNAKIGKIKALNAELPSRDLSSELSM